jgi:hypothetical protein
MLDDCSLTEKLAVARQWFRQSRAGEFEFTERHKDKFEELLLCAELDARLAELNAIAARGTTAGGRR